MWPVKKTALWTFFEHLILYCRSVSDFLSDISCGDFLIEKKKRYYIFYIAYCGVLIAHWEIFARFFFVSLLNDKFDKKDTLDCEKLVKRCKNFGIIAVSSWWIRDWWLFWMQVWSSMIYWMKKSGFLKVSNLRWDTL